MKFFLLLLHSFLFGMKLSAQNLVPNGSFEQLIGCPQGIGEIDSCENWFIEANSPDCFASCAPYPASVPGNLVGNQSPFEGENYAGLIPFISYGGNYREIIGAKLVDSLAIGNTYHFSMRICRGYNENQGVIIACNRLGAKFSKSKHVADYTFSHDNLQQLYEDSIITDSINWVLLQWDYTADSTYKYVYIGNSFDNAHTDTFNVGQPNTFAYYYVDSVNLFCVSSNCATGIYNEGNANNWMQYEEESANLNFHIDDEGTVEFFLINMMGEKILQTTVTDNMNIPLRNLSGGVYIAWLRTKDGSIVKKILIH